jgi:Dockerin type I domain
MKMQRPGQNPNEDAGELGAPAKLVAALKSACKSDIFIPCTIDEAVLRSARKHLSPPKRRAVTWTILFRWTAPIAALAVVLAVSVHLLLSNSRPKSGISTQHLYARGDLNRDGAVDILDAFALARRLKAGAVSNPELDINGDGIIDDRDVATLAAQAVRLGKGGHS